MGLVSTRGGKGGDSKDSDEELFRRAITGSSGGFGSWPGVLVFIVRESRFHLTAVQAGPGGFALLLLLVFCFMMLRLYAAILSGTDVKTNSPALKATLM
jgi:hypothetical protein